MADQRPIVVALGADHGGYELKRRVTRALRRWHCRVQDLGTHRPAPCDYPRYAERVARAVARGRAQRGILICKSGAGMVIAANKVPGVRAAAAATIGAAMLIRQHNDTNVLVLGAVGMPWSRAERIVKTWLTTPFEGGRHARRVRQITRIERTTSRLRS